MQKFLFLLIAVFHFANVSAQWKNVKSTTISFKIKNAGIKVDGSFKKATISIVVDDTKPENSSFMGIVDAKSISTGIKLRDTHLKEKEDFFNTEKFPSLTMKSVSVSQKKPDVYIVVWDLTMKGVARRFSSEVITKIVDNSLLLSTDFVINRNDWNVGGSSITMGDNVTVKLKSTLSK